MGGQYTESLIKKNQSQIRDVTTVDIRFGDFKLLSRAMLHTTYGWGVVFFYAVGVIYTNGDTS